MAHSNGTRPGVKTPRLSHWERFQARQVSQRYLTAAGAAAGFTLLKFTPSMRPAFFDLVRLIIARSRLETQLAGVLEQQDPATMAALHETLAAWTAWRRYTVQLARAYERLARRRQATLPPIPPEFQALASALDAVALDDDEEALP